MIGETGEIDGVLVVCNETTSKVRMLQELEQTKKMLLARESNLMSIIRQAPVAMCILMGPRHIVENEIYQYGEIFNPYTWVKPGITGLWQVSGRNDTTYEERTRLDEYYIRNWSIWLDLHILARTILVVIKRDGAY